MGMARFRQRIIDTTAPFLRPGERVEVASLAMVNAAPLAKTLALDLGLSLLSAIVTGGGGGVYSVAPKHFVVLTDQRLLFFAPHKLTGRPTRNLTGEVDRAGLAASAVRRGLTRAVTLTVPGYPAGIRLRFPLPTRRDADALAAALHPRPAINRIPSR